MTAAKVIKNMDTSFDKLFEMGGRKSKATTKPVAVPYAIVRQTNIDKLKTRSILLYVARRHQVGLGYLWVGVAFFIAGWLA